MVKIAGVVIVVGVLTYIIMTAPEYGFVWTILANLGCNP